jgi:holin-like protein
MAVLLGCQLAGEVIARLSHLPVPGPVIGMAILFTALVIRGSVPDGLEQVSSRLLGHLSLLFVPAGVGIMLHLGLIGANWLSISLALIGSTALTIAVTGLVMAWLSGRKP